MFQRTQRSVLFWLWAIEAAGSAGSAVPKVSDVYLRSQPGYLRDEIDCEGCEVERASAEKKR